MSERQAKKHYAGDDSANLRKLVRGSPWFERLTVLGKHWELTEPIAVWKPGDPEWDHEAISYKAISRWNRTETEPMTAYRASPSAHRLFGGRVCKLGTSAAHHLGVAGIFLALRASRQQQDWFLEDARFLARGSKRPDAFLGQTMLDFLGHYGPHRLQELYQMAVESQRPLEVW
jgi:hypothetical protein